MAAVLTVLSISACSKPAPSLSWREISLPGTAVVLRDVADCGDRWWAVGGAAGGPGAWTSVDGATWSSVPFTPLPTSYYGPREVINSVACSADRRVAAIGAVPGGAHGNPRVSTWRLAGGRFVENAAPFETYGGDKAVDVGRMAAGPTGFAIAGNRSSGAAAWISSASAREFRLFESAPGLAGKTVARDAAARPDGHWVLVGGAGQVLDQRAAAWISIDGETWTRDAVPDSGGFGEIERVIRDGDDLLAAGIRGTGIGLWRWHAGVWTAGDAFGDGAPGVRSLALAGGKPVVVAGGLYIDGVLRPAPAPPTAVAGRGSALLLAAGDRLWMATV